MSTVRKLYDWIVQISEGTPPYRGRFSLSPSAQGREGMIPESAEKQKASGQPDQIERSTSQQPPNVQASGEPIQSRGVGEKNEPLTEQLSVWERRRAKIGEEGVKDSHAVGQKSDPADDVLAIELTEQEKVLRGLLNASVNMDILFRDHFTMLGQRVVVVHSSVTCDETSLQDLVLRPLSEIEEPLPDVEVLARRLPCSDFTFDDHPSNLARAVITGKVVLLIGGLRAFICSVTKLQSRAVSTTMNESVVRGPQEAFAEKMETNLSILRRVVPRPDLTFAEITLQDTANTRICVVSVAEYANPRILAEVNRRLQNIGRVPLNASGLVVQYIEDHSRSLFPTTIYTERPDLVARYLLRGYVSLVVDNHSQVLIVPATLWMQLITAEDLYQRVWYANFLRIIRVIALFVAILLPSIYIGLVNFQHEMLPSPLLLAIKASRLNIPFPTVIEILILDIAFELIREASIRVPHVIGSTIGIVGALILGQAAVEANLVSPTIVILISVTGLGSFAIPNQEIGFAARILRFFFTFASFLLGFFGIAVFLSLMVWYLSIMQSFGVPYLTPITPYRPKEEGLMRSSVTKYKYFPASVHALPTKNKEVQLSDRMRLKPEVSLPGTTAWHGDSPQASSQGSSQGSSATTGDWREKLPFMAAASAGESQQQSTVSNEQPVSQEYQQSSQSAKPWRKPRLWRKQKNSVKG